MPAKQLRIPGEGKLLKVTGENTFIDGGFWHEFLNFCEKRLDDVIAKEPRWL